MSAGAPLPPGSSGMPLLGETPAFGTDPRGYVCSRRERYGPIFRSHLLGRPVVVMVGAEALRFVLITDRHRFRARDGWPRGLQELMAGALMMRDGEEHHASRRLLAPCFFGRSLEHYLPAMEEVVDRHLADWGRRSTLRLYDALKNLTFEVASRLILGSPPGEDLERLGRHFDAYCRGMQGIHPILRLRLPGSRYRRALRARELLLDHVARLAEERRRCPRTDALSRMVETADDAGKSLARSDIAEHALFLLFAGHESTTSLLTSLCLELARRAELLEPLRREQRAVAGEGALSPEAVAGMEALDRTLLEVERLYPPFTGGFRTVEEEFAFAGYRVPAGWGVFYAITGTHHDERLYERPFEFDADRFVGADVSALRRRCELVGFGAGPRICLGIEFARLEAKVVASRLMRDWRWELLPDQSLDPVYLPSIHPRDGLRVRFGRATVAARVAGVSGLSRTGSRAERGG